MEKETEELMFTLCAMLPEEAIVTEAHKLMSQYLKDPTSESFAKVAFSCQLVLIKRMVGNDVTNIEKITSDMENLKKLAKVIENSSN